MCGIFGYVGKENALKETLTGLKKLEYRGYDSAGIAYIDINKQLKIKKKIGKVSDLTNSLNLNINSDLAIAHTRWATHGLPNTKNCHPHYSGDFVIIHNGIIENYKELKEELLDKKFKFYSETDTEVIAKLLDYNFKCLYEKTDSSQEINNKILQAIVKTSEKLIGAWAVALINKKMPDKIYTFKKNSPLTASCNGSCSYISSDLNAIHYNKNYDECFYKNNSERYFVMKDDTIAELTKNNIIFYNSDLKVLNLWDIKIKNNEIKDDLNCQHYMLKEILEIPKAALQTYNEFKSKTKIKFFRELSNFDNITIIGCGTAYHAGLYGKYLFEKVLHKRIEVELSSEFRYKTPLFGVNDLVIAISQSGETADTIAGIKLAKEYGATTAVITNVEISTITSICDYVFLTRAGPEIGVAATKSYITQLFNLFLIGQYSISNLDENLIMQLIEKLEKTISLCKEKTIFDNYFNYKRFFFIGRSCDSSTASEGALKLKEIVYLHSEGYPSGELKHGTLSLVDEETLVIAIITQENIKEKTLNAVHETKARGAKVVIITQFEDLKNEENVIFLPQIKEELMPLISVIPLQFFAYYTSIAKGLNPDKPRNLAKSVTVE
jgi:glucosamine--fructose-6-phosphate aminotransferase (isomerizing)